MKGKTILAGVIAGLAFFMWGFIFWAASPLPKKVLDAAPAGEAVIGALSGAGAASGAYVTPSWVDQEKPEYRDKPYISLLIYRTGHGVSMGVAIGRGIAISVVLGILLATFAGCLAPHGRGFSGRLMFCVMMGLIFALAGPLVDWNWFSWPGNYLMLRAIDILGGFTAMGLVIAAMVKPCVHPECGKA